MYFLMKWMFSMGLYSIFEIEYRGVTRDLRKRSELRYIGILNTDIVLKNAKLETLKHILSPS